MKKRISVIASALLTVMAGMSMTAVHAAAGHEGSHGGHGSMPGHAGGSESMSGEAQAGHGGHAHDSWLEAPQDYAGRKWSGWGDQQAAARGQTTYQQQCAYCHGSDGKGTGPLAGRLEHKPADLTNNFHTAPGKGDDYLFWRITEGGKAEPFRSQKSAMPAFGAVMDEKTRWDVLTYVHQAFHGGFPRQSAGHGDGGEHHGGSPASDGHGHDH